MGGGLLDTSGEECERKCPAVNAVAHNQVVGLSEGEKAIEVATAYVWLPRCEKERSLLLFLDGEAVPLTIGDGVAGLVCRSDVEDGGDHPMEGHATILGHIILVGGKVYFWLTAEKKRNRFFISTFEDTFTNLFDTRHAKIGDTDRVHRTIAIKCQLSDSLEVREV